MSTEIKKGFLSAFLRLVRFEHALLYAFAVLIAEIIGSNGSLNISLEILILSLLVPIFSEMAAFAMNDFMDIKTDRLNKKQDRPLVSGEISPKFALVLSIISFAIAIFLSYFINMNIFAITVIVNSFAILYNVRMKDMPLFGNVYIAITMAIPFIFGNYVVSQSMSPVNITIAALGFIVGLAREIVKSVEDMKGDSIARKSKTLPLIIGAEKSLTFAAILYFIFVIFSIIPYYFFLNLGIGSVLVLFADLIFVYSAFTVFLSRKKPKNLKMLRKLSLAAL
ncbi:UbiA family prenyltransferase, partial [Candidatus Micrarchaeota archaeon]|nr:UbiA family prenyltransferase [Candidatus Micrarchaeota archaeon]